jgi:autotransporter passenger strand-loop-strand repeat protein
MTITVSSGVTQNDLTISAGDPLIVLSGGTVEYSTVLDGGSATLSTGAIGNGLTVSSGGSLVGPGDLEGYSDVAGSVSGVKVADDGFLELSSGGSALHVTVTAPAAQPYSYFEIDYGATASDTSVANGFLQDYGSAALTRIERGGEEDVFEGGRATNDIVESGGSLVLSGGKSTRATVQSGGLLVLSGGEAVEDTVLSGGALGIGGYVLTSDFTAGPVASATVISGVTVSSGGILDLYDVEVAQGVTVSLTSGTRGDDVFVDPGGVVDGPGALTGQTYVEGAINGVSIEGQLELTSGGIARGVTVAADGSLQVDFGASDTGATALSGALVNVLGAASGVVVASKGEEYVNSGGVDAGATVQKGGEAVVYSGGVAERGTIENGGVLALDGGTVTGETVLSGGTVDFEGLLTSDVTAGRVTGASVVAGVTLSSGALINVDGATVAAGATVSVAAGVVVSGLYVNTGGTVAGRGVLAGFSDDSGLVSGLTIGDPTANADGDLFVLSGGALSGVTIAAGGQVFLDSGASATGLLVLDRATVNVGGSVAIAQVESGATFSLASGALASNVAVASGGVVVGPGDLAGVDRIAGELSAVTLAAGGAVELAAGGTAIGVTLADQTTAPTTEFELDSGGTAAATVVGSNTREVVRSGGLASATTVLNGGLEYVLAAGIGAGTQVSAGGREIIASGGATRVTSVLSGGVESIAAGGLALELSVLAGGTLDDNGQVRIGGAGALDGTLAGSGAIVQTESGDLVLGAAGAAFTGRAVIEGGTIELGTANALGSGSVQFVEPSTGSAVLQIDAADAPAAGGTFANTIEGFSGANEDIDLRSIAYVAGATAKVTGGVLVLTDGGKTYAFKVAGSVADVDSVTSDGHGGTLIDPRAVAFAQTAAAFAPSAAARTGLVSSASPTAQTPFAHAAASAGHS